MFVAAAVLLAVWLAQLLESRVLGAALALALTLPLLWAATRHAVGTQVSVFRALSASVASFRDGDFSFSLARKRFDELDELIQAHNDLGDVLRGERQALFQRELLLDTVVQNTPVALLLAEPRGAIVYANVAARQLFNEGRKLEGHALSEVLARGPASLREALGEHRDRLFSFEQRGQEETYHVARRDFRLNARPHTLFLFKRLTAELSRQEVATWKKVIRVISHELNNSLAPVTSLAHSGAELVRRGEYDRLGEIFATIEERGRHLHGFIRGYASVAKLPLPTLEAVSWSALLQGVRAQYDFVASENLPDEPAHIDAAQVAQALINLVKNAHESGSRAEEIRISVARAGRTWTVHVSDRGQGMSDAVLANALVPFYSTKRSGTGLGLALVREIAEAHGGRVMLANRQGGGLAVTLTLPA